MKMLPVFWIVAAKRVVQILALGQVSLHLVVLLPWGILIITEKEIATITVKIIKE